jgi:two-component system sensor histidine kinase PilS (NtrC family)
MADQTAADFPPVDFWRSLRYFNLYRLTLASLFVFLAGAFGSALSLSERNWTIFFVGSLVYAAVVALSFVPLRLGWPRFAWQLAIQIGGDIAGLTVLSYASGGIQSSIGLLMLVSLAAAGLISRGKITLFFAALASIAALLEHSYAVLYDDAVPGLYVQVGLLCMSYFAVAWLAHTLAKYAVDSQQLAQRRGRDLVSLSEANRLVMRDMQDGVLVVDGDGVTSICCTKASARGAPCRSPFRYCLGSMRYGSNPEAQAGIFCNWIWGCRPGYALLQSSRMSPAVR